MTPDASSAGAFPPHLLRLALQTAGDCLFVVDADGRVAVAGCNAPGSVGVDAVAGRRFDGIWGEAAAAAEAARRAAAEGRPAGFSAVVEKADGRRRHWRVSLVPTGEADAPDRVLAVARDVTEEAEAEAALARRARLHEALIEATTEIVWHLEIARDVSHRRGWEAFTGRPLSDADPHGWLAFVHPDDRREALTAIETAIAAREPYVVEYRLMHRSGGWRQVEDHAVPLLDADGRVTDWIGIVTDIHDRKAAERDLAAGALRLRLALEAAGLGTWDVEIATGRRSWSAELCAMLGLPADAEPSEALLLACVHPDDRDAVARLNRTAFHDRDRTGTGVFRVIRRTDGALRWIRTCGRMVPDEEGRPFRRIGTFQDITEQQETKQALKRALKRTEALIAATSEIVWTANADQTEGGGTGWDAFTGQSNDDAEGDGWLSSVHPADRAKAARTCAEGLAAGSAYVNEYRLRHVGGDWRWVIDRAVPLFDDDGRLSEWVGIISDINDRKAAEERIWRAAHTDDLTGLANRAQFRARLDAALAARGPAAGQEGGAAGGPGAAGEVALLLIDLDRFKEVNDSLGHDAGDRVLVAVADRLRATVPAEAVIARLGGDEFGVILAGAGAEAAAALAGEILAVLKAPLPVAGREIDGAATIGWALCRPGADDPAELLKNADIALYAAKTAGRGRAVPFADAMRAELDRRVTVLRNAKDALARDAVHAFYQPKVSLRTGRVTGFEALLRWHDGVALRAPGAIEEAFKDHDLACRIGERMLETVVADMVRWTEAGLPFGTMALNAAAPEFRDPGYAEGVLRRLEAAGLSPGLLEIEVTESVLLDSEGTSVASALAALNRAGVAVTLDDFGTGYASLTHLKRHPVSWLKIDRSFVSNLETDPDSAAIVQAVLGMARNIGIRVVAEGVETDWQMAFLRANACDVAQGYRISKPMAASRVPNFLATWGEGEIRQSAVGR